jgi:hypothetical protein
MRVKRTSMPIVEIGLDLWEARELLHMLSVHKTGLQAGQHGTGTSIDDQMDLIEDIIGKVSPMTDRMGEELVRGGS